MADREGWVMWPGTSSPRTARNVAPDMLDQDLYKGAPFRLRAVLDPLVPTGLIEFDAFNFALVTCSHERGPQIAADVVALAHVKLQSHGDMVKKVVKAQYYTKMIFSLTTGVDAMTKMLLEIALREAALALYHVQIEVDLCELVIDNLLLTTLRSFPVVKTT